ncbi:N-acetylneuraminate synthase family protein [Arundinibacter roseus]|uniref:N-acetylneuraminate synthase n=1 Tax=Arundinibacter roseus TaxID=2070510 RepID=A0A4R4KAN5_9BACT|nr:N-acetylneuraminate synthase family protein [Arundinibacter roseus]TDB63461.1 N-acetylneuraminate synthase [Arundinibacter roseus]
MTYTLPKVISEIGCNHMGQFEIAKELILLSKECKADYAKFQKRNSRELLTSEQYEAPHPVPYNAYGATYGAHREFLEFSQEQHADLKRYAESIGIGYTTSVWDVTSAQEIIELAPEFVKVPSACNNHFEMLKLLRDGYAGDVHVSTGMTTLDEIEQLVAFFEETNQAKNRLVVYNCTSGYPVPFKDICLLEIRRIQENYGDRVKEIGFSGHHLGIAIDLAAYTLGAVWIERHFTKDRTWRGTDHAASLEVPGLQKLVRDLHHTYEALTYKPTEILEIEQAQRDKLKYRVH